MIVEWKAVALAGVPASALGQYSLHQEHDFSSFFVF
jgi:hypothetical protein